MSNWLKGTSSFLGRFHHTKFSNWISNIGSVCTHVSIRRFLKVWLSSFLPSKIKFSARHPLYIVVLSKGKTMCKMLWEQGVGELKLEDTILLTASFPWYLIWVRWSMSGTSQEESRITSFLGAGESWEKKLFMRVLIEPMERYDFFFDSLVGKLRKNFYYYYYH